MIKHTTFMKIAYEVSYESKAVRRKVGAVIVKDNNIIALGYNGTPSGFDNCCEDKIITDFKMTSASIALLDGEQHGCVSGQVNNFELRTKPEVLHAESNAISKCAKSTLSSDGADLYTTTAPCLECSKLIIQAGIKQVFFAETYSSDEGLKLLEKAGIYLERIFIGSPILKVNFNADIKDAEAFKEQWNIYSKDNVGSFMVMDGESEPIIEQLKPHKTVKFKQEDDPEGKEGELVWKKIDDDDPMPELIYKQKPILINNSHECPNCKDNDTAIAIMVSIGDNRFRCPRCEFKSDDWTLRNMNVHIKSGNEERGFQHLEEEEELTDKESFDFEDLINNQILLFKSRGIIATLKDKKSETEFTLTCSPHIPAITNWISYKDCLIDKSLFDYKLIEVFKPKDNESYQSYVRFLL